MKIVVLIGGGRSGIDFFQSLFDKHSQISQFPGVIFFDDFWKKIKKINDLKEILDIFYKDYDKFFDSRLNLIERHHMLGDRKNEYYIIDKNIFEKKFKEYFSEKEVNKLNIIKSLHLAYSAASGENLSTKKIIFLHLHHISRLHVLRNINHECIYTTRDPLASYTSLMKNWDNIKGNKQTTPSMYYFHLDRLFNGVRDIFKNNKKTYVIKLEDLHRKNSFVMKSLCDKLNLNFEDNLKISSYQGKLWWGDQVSGRDINGINPNFNNKINEKLFFKKDIKCIEYFLSEYLKKYNYTITKNIINCEFLKYLPFKIELKCWLNAIITLNLKEILKVPYLWYKRVCYMNKKNFRSENFPEPLGNK